MPDMLYDMKKVRDKRKAFQTRLGGLKTERSSWQSHWSDLTRYIKPRSGRFFIGDRNRTGRALYNAIYDNTGTRALRVLGAGMMAGATSPARPWFKLATPDPDLSSHHPVRLWLDDVVTRMQRVFARSNVYRALHTAYEDLGCFGTAAMLVLPDFTNVIHCYPITCGQYCLQQDYQGKINTIFREFQKTVAEVVREFGYANCSMQTQKAYDNGDLESTVDILHVIEPRDDRERNIESPFAKDMPWKSCYLELNGDENKLLRDSGFRRLPLLAPRWQVDGEDVYGTSPGMDALGDIRQLQQEQLRKGQGIDYKVRPPLQVPTSLKDREDVGTPGNYSFFEPGATLPFDQVTPNGGIRSAFEVNLDLNDLLVDIQDVRVRIKQAFYEDLFLMLANAGPDTRMTATEVAERHEEKLLMLGPVLERLHNELLSPLIDLTFERMLEVGALPTPPPELEGVDLTVEFVSILAQAQRAIGSNSVDRFMGNAIELSKVKPDVLDKINFDKWVDTYSHMLGVDSQLIVDDDTVLALRQARAEAQAAAEQVAAQREQAATIKDLATAPTSGPTALTGVMDALTGYGTPVRGSL